MRALVLPHAPRALLWAELLLLFVVVPLLMAAFFGRYSVFGALWIGAGLAAALLSVTGGFRWRSTLRAPQRGFAANLLGFTLASAAVVLGAVLLVAPQRLLHLPLAAPQLWLTVLVAYPLLSALPQELIFRTLFFARYGALFPGRAAQAAASGFAFAFGHLFYMNPIAIGLSFAGGTAIAWFYARDRSLAFAWALHVIGGSLVFTLGLGWFFYHGAIGRAW